MKHKRMDYGEIKTIVSHFILLILISDFAYAAIPPKGSSYCVPHDETGAPSKCWPQLEIWDALRNKLTGNLKPLESSNYKECIWQGSDAFGIEKTGNGMCMQYHDCSKAFCNARGRWNIPTYSVEAHDVKDIQVAMAFANEHNIAVTVKTSGHSYSGSSMGYGTLLIWMYKFQKYGNIISFKDSCDVTYPHVLHIGGGQVWKEAYDAVGDRFHIIGGGGLTVSAAGGWLMGGGLSAMSRNLGIGIDNVLRFEVVLADGRHVLADKCSHPDLFWALRGGGGGSFGVVTSAYFKLHPVSNIVFSYFSVNDVATWPHPMETTDSWLDFWVEKSPYLDNRWGGYWTLNTHILYFQGSLGDAKATFLDDVTKWKKSLPEKKRVQVTHDVSTHKSYYTQRGGKYASTDKTGEQEFNIASRLIPRDFVLNKPEEAKKVLKWIARNGFFTFNYLLGGVMMDVNETGTAVHPAMRKAIWQIETFQENLIQHLRDSVNDTGAGYNHASKSEPDWENAFWGKNLKRLKELKQKYDPQKRFNCWHCVGYQKMPSAPSSSAVAAAPIFVLGLCILFINLVL